MTQGCNRSFERQETMAFPSRSFVLVFGGVLLAVAGAAAMLVVQHLGSGHPAAHAAAAPVDVQAQLRRQAEELAALRQELHGLRRTRLQARSSRPPPAARAEATDLMAELQAADVDAQVRTAREFEALLARHAAEPRDAAWAVQAEAGIEAALETALRNTGTQGPVPHQLDCRRTGCRISLAGGEDADDGTLAQILLLELADTVPYARVLTLSGADGRFETHVFASK